MSCTNMRPCPSSDFAPYDGYFHRLFTIFLSVALQLENASVMWSAESMSSTRDLDSFPGGITDFNLLSLC